jgi:hypothetical protein
MKAREDPDGAHDALLARARALARRQTDEIPRY